MRSTTRLFLGLGLLGALAACGGSDNDDAADVAELGDALSDAVESAQAAPDDDGDGDGGEPGDLAGLADEVPDCPFTAEQVSDLAGTPLREDGPCYFIDGVGLVQATMSSQLAGMTTYDYARQLADERFDRVTDLDQGETVGFVGVDDIEGEAVLIVPSGSYTITVSSLSLGPDGNESFLYSMLDLIPAS